MSAETASWISPLAAGLLGAVVVLSIAAVAARRIVRRAREGARRILADVRHEADNKAKELLVSAQERALAAQEEADRRERDVENREAALEARSRELEGRRTEVDRLRRELERRAAAVARSEDKSRADEAEASARLQEARITLERIAGMTAEQARAELVAEIETEARREGARIARLIEEEARETSQRAALNLLVQATQRLNLRQAVESTVTFIELPNDEMKGRIIGREGRNIRALEMATGIDVIVDDTPGAILISCFDPIRREIARISIQRLLEDGRIHPARIEEVVARVREEMEALVEEAGAQAAFSLGVSDLHPRLARLVGRMRFRTHHGHNLLQHASEVAVIASHMATEFGARSEVALRAGLLHEIGRVEDGAGGHTILASAELAAKYGETEPIVHAIQSLHPDVEAKTVEALLLRTANRISDNRPGARKENLKVFIERLRRLEGIASAFEGVTQAFAVKAGKELRVLVDAKGVPDEGAYALAKRIAQAVEKDLAYPGPVKVSVVRETRAVQYAL